MVGPPADYWQMGVRFSLRGQTAGQLEGRAIGIITDRHWFDSNTSHNGRVAQRLSACATRKKTLVRFQPRPPSSWALSDNGNTSGLHPEDRSSILRGSTPLPVMFDGRTLAP